MASIATRHWLRPLLAAGTLWLGAGGVVAAVPAQQRDLDVLRSRIQRLQSELDRLARDRGSVVREFEAADVELALRRRQLEVLERRGELLRAARQRQQQQVQQLQQRARRARAALARHVASLYRIGPLSYGRLLLAADTASEALLGYQLVTYLATRDRDTVASLRDSLSELDSASAKLAQTDQSLQQVRADTAAAVEAITEQQEQRRKALGRLDREAEARRQALADAESAARRLESKLADLEGDRVRPDRTLAPFAEARGHLPWPVDGPVVGNFGRRRHPVYDTYTTSRGIEIGAEAGVEVQAVFAGRVVFADWYTGYGLLVILQHGNDYFTLYGHLESVDVLVNQQVSAGQVLGRVGDTGSLTGANLYFEVRQGTDALDPLRWLQRR